MSSVDCSCTCNLIVEIHEDTAWCRYAVHVHVYITENPLADLRGNSNPSEQKCAMRDLLSQFHWRGIQGGIRLIFFQQKVCSFNTNTHSDIKNIQIDTNRQSWYIFLHTEVSHEAHHVETGRVPLGVAALVLHAISGTRSWRPSRDAAWGSGWVIGIWTCRGVRMILYVLRVDEFERSCWNKLETAEGDHTQNQKQRQLYSLKHAQVKHEQGQSSNSIKAPEKNCR